MLIGPKIFLCSVIFRTMPHAFILITLIEISFNWLYHKLTKTKLDFVFSVLPTTFISSLIDTKHTKAKFLILTKFCGAFNCIILHYSSLLLIYLPSHMLLNSSLFTSGNNYFSFNNIEIFAFTIYTLSIGPYLIFLTIDHKFVRRRKELYATLEKSTEPNISPSEQIALIEIDSQVIDPESNEHENEHTHDLNPAIYVCPVKPKASFMKENTPLINKKINEMSENKNES